MIRSPNDGVHLETPQAQTGSSSEGVRSATSGNTPCAASPAENSIPGPTSIDDTKEAELVAEQPVSAARSAGATTSGSKAVNEDSEDMRGLTDGRFSIRAEATVETEDLRELTGNRHRQDSEHVRYLREHGDAGHGEGPQREHRGAAGVGQVPRVPARPCLVNTKCKSVSAP